MLCVLMRGDILQAFGLLKIGFCEISLQLIQLLVCKKWTICKFVKDIFVCLVFLWGINLTYLSICGIGLCDNVFSGAWVRLFGMLFKDCSKLKQLYVEYHLQNGLQAGKVISRCWELRPVRMPLSTMVIRGLERVWQTYCL